MKIETDVDMDFHVDDVQKMMPEKIEKALTMIGMQAEGYAKLNLEGDPRRVDTGRLRNSITWATSHKHSEPANTSGDDANEVRADDRCPDADDDYSVNIGTNVEYAVYVHEGTAKLDPNRFLRDAVEQHADEYRQMIDDVMKEE